MKKHSLRQIEDFRYRFAIRVWHINTCTIKSSSFFDFILMLLSSGSFHNIPCRQENGIYDYLRIPFHFLLHIRIVKTLIIITFEMLRWKCLERKRLFCHVKILRTDWLVLVRHLIQTIEEREQLFFDRVKLDLIAIIIYLVSLWIQAEGATILFRLIRFINAFLTFFTTSGKHPRQANGKRSVSSQKK